MMTANDGDTIMVLPGRYGDINGTGSLGDAGEEPAGGHAAIGIIRRLRILSKEGAEVTTIDAAGATSEAIWILTDGVTFGAKGHGFTIMGGHSAGLSIGGIGEPPKDVRVEGNIVARNDGPGFLSVIFGRHLVVANNIATNNGGAGFDLRGCLGEGCEPPGDLILVDNVSSFNSGTDEFSPGGAGYALTRTRAIVERNLASNNPAYGFVVSGGSNVIRNNTATNNALAGFSVAAGRDQSGRFIGNTAVGNRGPGIVVSNFGRVSYEVHESNFYGNGTRTSDFPAYPANCGLANLASHVSATNNFWGASGGPGADPADNAGAGSGCDKGSGSVTRTVPFARIRFAIRP
jgi:parallel beta-helix repeat protein